MEIVFIRHGKPTGSTNPKLTAKEFAWWVRDYNRSEVAESSKPPVQLKSQLSGYYVVSSNLRRAIHSASLCLAKDPDLTLRGIREIDIPRHKIPLVLRAKHWLFINRLLWLLGLNAKAESLKDAKVRAKNAALEIVDIANKHEKVAVFGHGLMNRSIAKELESVGWQCTDKDSSYWGVIRLKSN
ncbi:histidine phosphatase family protein [Photobacterium sp. OFAV2-7]|uniref:histidine phosphatase family protein n=1 Tax=Photobacterium sp. OFAV2-7 TaxID=2917748 RepID=UPI001EF4CE48|nr:phosphoglycerate mutase family protein [Photobacterium sp. OFAV2-7]MCG7588760.1 histidine phosphatase family protein [Photobacterium sp. OFAV2-7]